MGLNIDRVKQLLAAHDEFWEDARSPHGFVGENLDLYYQRFWEHRDAPGVPVETAKAYQNVESYLSSLFSVAPEAQAQHKPNEAGRPEEVSAVFNQWVREHRETLTTASRYSLLAGAGFLKTLAPDEDSPLDAQLLALPPWEVVVDLAASSWDAQRFVMHAYWMPLDAAHHKYPKVKWAAGQDFDEDETLDMQPEPDGWVRIVEVYDNLDEKFFVWTPSVLGGTEEKPGKVLVKPQEFPQGIPPILMLAFQRDVEHPLRGVSVLGRVKDQIKEHLQIRSVQAAAVSKVTRQWLVRAGAFDNKAKTRLRKGQDGTFIEANIMPEQKLNDQIVAVPMQPVPDDFATYIAQVQADLDMGSMLAPFVTGQPTRSTASEVLALSQYTATELGKMSSVRDGVVSALGDLYIRTVRPFVNEPVVYVDDGRVRVLPVEALEVPYFWTARDTGGTPQDRAMKKQEAMMVAPLMMQLGADPKAVRAYVARIYGLPPELTKGIPPAPMPAEGQTQSIPAMGQGPQAVQAALGGMMGGAT